MRWLFIMVLQWLFFLVPEWLIQPGPNTAMESPKPERRYRPEHFAGTDA